MYDMYKIILIMFSTTIMSMFLTEIVRFLSFKFGAVDEPNSRRLNTETMPSAGGLAIYASYFITILFLLPIDRTLTIPVFLGATVIVITGLLDDIKDLSPKMKLLGMLGAALIIYYVAGVRISMVELPILGKFDLGYLSLPVTILWIIAITNSINLIDGLDGLATGVSAISLFTMGIIAYFFLNTQNVTIAIMIFTLAFASLGFLPANYNPAKIYLGDTGALFLGFMISVLSLYGLKNATFLTMVVPLVILTVPIADTLYAIIRRKLNNQPISLADNRHIHHRIMALGFTHKQTVKLIYAMTLVFSFIALLYPVASPLGATLLSVGLIIGLELLAEMIGLVGENHRPLLNFGEKMLKKINFSGKSDGYK